MHARVETQIRSAIVAAAFWRLAGMLSLPKILLDAAAGQALSAPAAWASVPLAHLAGWSAESALIVGYWLRLGSQYK